MQHKDQIILQKMLEEIAVMESLLGCITYEEFDAQEEKKRAVAMTVINIGELAKHLSNEFFSEHELPELKYAARTRDVYAHGYATLSFPMVYKTAAESFPELGLLIKEVLSATKG